MSFRDDRDALRARNLALEEELEAAKRELAAREPDAGASEQQPAPAPEHARGDRSLRAIQARRAASSNTRLAPRVLSVFTRAWVIVCFGLPALFGVVALVGVPAARLPVAAALVLGALVVVVVDAFLRRCPSCRRFLAGTLLSVVRDEHDFHVSTWQCAFCKRRWRTERAATR